MDNLDQIHLDDWKVVFGKEEYPPECQHENVIGKPKAGLTNPNEEVYKERYNQMSKEGIMNLINRMYIYTDYSYDHQDHILFVQDVFTRNVKKSPNGVMVEIHPNIDIEFDKDLDGDLVIILKPTKKEESDG